MSNVFTMCENCKAQFPHETLTKCPSCGSESVYIDTELVRDVDYSTQDRNDMNDWKNAEEL